MSWGKGKSPCFLSPHLFSPLLRGMYSMCVCPSAGGEKPRQPSRPSITRACAETHALAPVAHNGQPPGLVAPPFAVQPIGRARSRRREG